MKKGIWSLILGCFLFSMAVQASDRTASPADANAVILSPVNGEVVANDFTVKFGLQGMGVAPAGVTKKNTGHFHLIVDGKLPAMDKPMGKQVKHFGGGQIETQLNLSTGEHTLQLIMGDAKHVPHHPPVVSKQITITVK